MKLGQEPWTALTLPLLIAPWILGTLWLARWWWYINGAVDDADVDVDVGGDDVDDDDELQGMMEGVPMENHKTLKASINFPRSKCF